MPELKVLGICGSLRRASRNIGLLRHAQQHAPQGMTIDIADLADMPFYNADIADKPAPVIRLLMRCCSPVPNTIIRLRRH